MGKYLGAAKPNSRMFKRGTIINVSTGTKPTVNKPAAEKKPTKKEGE